MTKFDLLCAAKVIVLQQQSSSKGDHAAKSNHAAKPIMHGGLPRHCFLHMHIKAVLSVTCAETTELGLSHMQNLHSLVSHLQQEQSCMMALRKHQQVATLFAGGARGVKRPALLSGGTCSPCKSLTTPARSGSQLSR